MIKLPPTLSLVPPDANSFGNPKADLKVIEFADLNCPSCQHHSPLVKEFVRQHFDHVELVYRNFPLPVMRPTASPVNSPRGPRITKPAASWMATIAATCVSLVVAICR